MYSKNPGTNDLLESTSYDKIQDTGILYKGKRYDTDGLINLSDKILNAVKSTIDKIFESKKAGQKPRNAFEGFKKHQEQEEEK